jgi:hypothetical protein
MKKTLLLIAVVGGMLMACTNKKQTTNNDMEQELTLTQEWDKVFPQSDKVNHKKVTFETQYGLTLAADLYDGGYTDLVGKGEPKDMIPWDKLEEFFKTNLQ